MRRILTLSLTLIFLASLLVADSIAQHPQRRATPRPDTVEHEGDATMATCPTDIAHCPPGGCGTGADSKLNSAKNRTDMPSGTIQPITLNQMRSLSQPRRWTVNADRSPLVAQGEGKPVVLMGFLLRAKKEGAESCNCGITGVENTDIHNVIVDDPNAIEATSVTVEMTPRVRKDGHPDWVQSKVKQFEGDFVRITGWQMLDTQHISRPLVRATNWEIHPVMKFEHCTSTVAACKRGRGWQEF
jgi:hypothetical protein